MSDREDELLHRSGQFHAEVIALRARCADLERERDVERSRFAHHGAQAEALAVEIGRQPGEWGHLRYRIAAHLSAEAQQFQAYAAGQPSPSNWRKRAEAAEATLTTLRAQLDRLREALKKMPRYVITGKYGGNYEWREHPKGDWVRADDWDEVAAVLTDAAQEEQ